MQRGVKYHVAFNKKWRKQLEYLYPRFALQQKYRVVTGHQDIGLRIPSKHVRECRVECFSDMKETRVPTPRPLP
jgi:hypothetical protein